MKTIITKDGELEIITQYAKTYMDPPERERVGCRGIIIKDGKVLLSLEERKQLIKENPAYGNIICRCEMITEGEIMDAINRPLGAKSLDGVKRRTRAGMGRCQSGFCAPRTMEILARELGVDMSEITKMGGNSKIIVGMNKDSL